MKRIMLAVSSFSLVAIATFIIQAQTTATEINGEPIAMKQSDMASNTQMTD